MLREWRRKRISERLRLQVEFNESRIRSFRTIAAEKSEILLSEIEISKAYNEKYLERVVRKYDVNPELANKAINTAQAASEEHEKAVGRYLAYIRQAKKDKDIELHKKAILELKSEGQLS